MDNDGLRWNNSVSQDSYLHEKHALINGYSMSEETHDAAVRGPVAIRMAVLVSGLVGWMLTVTFCFCMNDPDGIMSSPTGLPVAQIFLNAGGPTGGTIMWFFVMLVQFFTGCSAMLANARMAYAFARDEALPFSRYVFRLAHYDLRGLQQAIS